MLIRGICPHHVGHGRIWIRCLCVAQSLTWRPEEHYVWTRNNPVIIRSFSHCCGIGVAGTTSLARRASVTTQHICDSELIRWWLMAHHCMDELHTVLVGAHSVRAHGQAGEAVRP